MSPPQNINFETVLEWFERAKDAAQRQGRSDSAALWHDGIEWLKYWHQEATKAKP